MDRPIILYDHATIHLDPDSNPFLEGCRTEFKDAKFYDGADSIKMTVGGDYVLEMEGVAIPLWRRHESLSDESVANDVRKLLGDFGGNLELCARMAEKRRISNNFHFTPHGLSDCSNPQEMEGKRVTEWVIHARDYSSNALGELSRIIDTEGGRMELVPTFEALASKSAIGRVVGDFHTIEGPTFSDRVANFLDMYDAVMAHIEWKEEEGRRIRREIRAEGGRPFNPNMIRDAEFIRAEPSRA